MHKDHIHLWQHNHDFNTEKKSSEVKTLIVVVITLLTMFAEIFFGWIFNSMALFADGWHMGTHAAALGISLGAYMLARRHAKNLEFTFGTWKIEVLGAYTSAIILGIVGIAMVFVSVERMFKPLEIRYDQALVVAVIGLAINIICALILGAGHGHDHEHKHEEGQDHGMDLNLKSAYIHVIADALTSVLAIGALLGAKFLHFNWLDPAMGILGAILILRWAFSLLRETAHILLDRQSDSMLGGKIRETIEADKDSKVSDLHIWQVSQGQFACIVSVVTGSNLSYSHYKKLLDKIPGLAHVTVEVLACSPERPCTSDIS